MDYETLLSTDITRIRKDQLKEILLKYNINTTGDKIDTIRKKASIFKQSILLSQSEPPLRDFITGVINHTHVFDTKQKQKFPVLAELEKIVLYENTANEHEYESLTSDSETENSPESNISGSRHIDIAYETQLPSATSAHQLKLPKPPTYQAQYIPAMTENLPLISAGSFNGLNSENATDFIEKYLLAADSNNWTDQTKLKLFPSHLGGMAINWFKNYKSKAPNNTIPDWNTLKNDFLQAFTPLAQCSSLSAILENKLQGPNETTLSYLLDITTTCRRYDPNTTEAQIISYILRGLRPEILQKVLTKQNDTLDRLEKNLKEAELLEIQLKQNLALYSKQSSSHNNSFHNSNNKEVTQLQQQVKVLTDLVATILPNKPQTKNWSSGPGNSSGYHSNQQPNRRPNQYKQQNTPLQNTFRAPHSTSQLQPRATLAQCTSSPKFCDYCKTNTHSTEFCWFRAHRLDHPKYNQSIICRYCKQPGHVMQQCIKSRFYDPLYNGGPQQRSPITSSSSSKNGSAGGSSSREAPPL